MRLIVLSCILLFGGTILAVDYQTGMMVEGAPQNNSISCKIHNSGWKNLQVKNIRYRYLCNQEDTPVVIDFTCTSNCKIESQSIKNFETLVACRLPLITPLDCGVEYTED